MNKRIRIFSAILAVVLLAAPILSVSVSAVESTPTPTARGQLAITELNAADVNNTAYQYIEILNTSKVEIDLSEYYLYRWGASNRTNSYDLTILKNILGDGAPYDLARAQVTQTSTVLNPGEVAILWLNTRNVSGGVSPTGSDQNSDSVIDVKDFRLKWGIEDTVKVVNVAFSFEAAKFYKVTTTSNYSDSYNSGFLPIVPGDCIVNLTHKDSVFEGFTASGKPMTPANDTVTTAVTAGALTGAAALARHKAADCSALFFTEDYGSSAIPTSNVFHFFEYFDPDAYELQGAALGTIAVNGADNYRSFVTGKKNASGDYAVNNGLYGYADKATPNNKLYFADEGNARTASPGSLEVGQFGYRSAELMGTQSRIENDGTYSVRFVASIDEAELTTAQKAGFEIIANYTDKNGQNDIKTITGEIFTVYASIYGKGENGTGKYTQADLTNGHSYFLTMTVNNISIDTYEDVTFTVTPYIVDGNGTKHTFYSGKALYNDGVRDTTADAPLSKEDQILNGFAIAQKTTPVLHDLAGLQPTGDYAGIRAVWFDGMNYGGEKTKVFAYVGVPEGASATNQVPAVVLLHGGGGHAFLCWIKMWNDRGYAAIAIDTTGYFPTAVNAGSTETCSNWSYGLPASIAETGYTSAPNKDNMSSSAGRVDNMWMYHAVGQAILAGNVLRGDARVDSDKIGITGVSWGGVITSLTIGYEDRFAFAVPVYGSGYLDEAKSWMKNHFSSDVTKKLWLAQNRFENVKMPVLWLCWNDDNCFSINSNTKSYLDTVQNNTDTRISMVSEMRHSHTAAWRRPESMAFADSVVKGGAKLTGFVSQPSDSAQEIDLMLNVDASATRVAAKLYYITSPMTYSRHYKYGKTDTFMDQEWQTLDLTVSGNRITGTLPVEARGYYVEVVTTINGTQYVTTSVYVVPTLELPKSGVEVDFTTVPDIGEDDRVDFEDF